MTFDYKKSKSILNEKVQERNDHETSQSERNRHSKTRGGGKKLKNDNQVVTLRLGGHSVTRILFGIHRLYFLHNKLPQYISKTIGMLNYFNEALRVSLYRECASYVNL